MKTINSIGIAAVLLLTIIASCKKKDICSPMASATATEEILMINTTYSPVEKTIARGTTVRWVNRDPYAHTVTSSTNGFDSGNMNEGQTFEYTFHTSGTFDYFCKFHPGMTGKIIVQ